MNKVAFVPLVSLLTLATFSPAAPPSGGDRLPPAPTPQQLRFDRRSPIVIAVERVKGAVVNISSTRLVKVRGFLDDDMLDRFFAGADPFSRTVEATSLGSGVVIHPAGYVLTNAHVVALATTITCSFSKKTEHKARLISADPAHDLAILKIDSPDPLPYVPLGRSDDLMIGETVIAIGNPLGYSHTVTTGVVSALGREIRLSDELKLDDLVQTDASINPGNSGGPLLNINGELIGITTAIRGDAQNIGFAIPIDQARGDLAYLLDFARVNDQSFGAAVSDSERGPVVGAVQAKSPAADAGLKSGDVIAAIDDLPVGSLLEFNVTMLGKSAGQTVRLAVQRKSPPGQATLKLVLAKSPKPDGNALLWDRFGMKARTLNKEESASLHLPASVGLIVTQMADTSLAHKVGLRVGDVLVQIDKLAINSIDNVGAALKDVAAGQTLRMVFLRDRYQISLNLKGK